MNDEDYFIKLTKVNRKELEKECRTKFPDDVIAVIFPIDAMRLADSVDIKNGRTLESQISDLLDKEVPKAQIARILNISRQTVYRKIKEMEERQKSVTSGKEKTSSEGIKKDGSRPFPLKAKNVTPKAVRRENKKSKKLSLNVS